MGRSAKIKKMEEDRQEAEAQEKFAAQAAALRRGGAAALASIKSTKALQDDFDSLAKSLRMEAKAKATDRIKSEEELAADEAAHRRSRLQ